jgi:acetyl esterase
VDGAFGGLSRVGRLFPRSKPDAHGCERVPDVAYGDAASPWRKLDIYRPAETQPGGGRPAVLYAHGGAFQSLSKETHWLHGLAFARRGYVVFIVDYRLAPRHPFPAALEDVCAAASWLQDNAARWGADAERLVLGGDSAGANLVASLAAVASWRREEPWAREVFDREIRPRAVSAAYGVFQVSDTQRLLRRKRIPWFVAQRLLDVEDCYLAGAQGPLDLADPLRILESAGPPDRPLPPFFLPVGTADPLLDDTRRLAEALRRRGVEAVDRYYRRELHGFDTLIWRPAARECWVERFQFLARQLGGEPKKARGAREI